jgi:hypothetical protein
LANNFDKNKNVMNHQNGKSVEEVPEKEIVKSKNGSSNPASTASYTNGSTNPTPVVKNAGEQSMYMPIKALNTFSRDWKI